MTDPIFLTRDQLKTLTGTSDRKRQIECLRNNRIPFTVDVFGRPVVTIATITGQRGQAQPEKQGWDGPGFLKVA